MKRDPIISPQVIPPHPWDIKIIENRNRPLKWNIEGLWMAGSLAAVHALEEQYKSILVYTGSDQLARGVPFLRRFAVTRPHRVGIIQTEMTEAETCPRLEAMYRNAPIPNTLQLTDDAFRATYAAAKAAAKKIEMIQEWATQNTIEIVVIDTINSLLASYGDPNGEMAASHLLDDFQRLKPMQVLFVRHDGKPSMTNAGRSSNQRMRGSNRLVEEPAFIMSPERRNKRTREVVIEVGKARSSTNRPANFSLWLDSEDCRLHPVPPIVRILEGGRCRRDDLMRQAERRFGMARRSVERHLSEDLSPYVITDRDRHGAIYSLNLEAIAQASAQLAESDDPAPDKQWYLYVERIGGERSTYFGGSANLPLSLSRQSPLPCVEDDDAILVF